MGYQTLVSMAMCPARRKHQGGAICASPSRSLRRRRRTHRHPALSLQFLLHALLTFSTVHNVRNAARAQTVSVGSFIDEEALNKCKDALNAADFNGDQKVSAEEYIAYIKGDAGPAVEVTADELVEIPLSLVVLFVRYACKCIERPDADAECCHGDKAHLNIVDDGSPAQSVFLMDFCLDAQDAIAEIRERVPTQPPTEPPTATPTGAPTAAPTLENQMSVRLQYTLTNEEEGLNAEAVMSGDGNTLKADLEAATRIIVIRTLNETAAFMRSRIAGDGGGDGGTGMESGALAMHDTTARSRTGTKQRTTSIFERLKQNRENRQQKGQQDSEGENNRRKLGYDENMQRYLAEGAGPFLAQCGIDVNTPGDTVEDRAVALALADIYRRSQRRLRQLYRRRLAIYTDELPAEIYMVLDDPTCSPSGTINCLVIFTRIFLLLERRDDRDTIRQLVSQGVRNSFADGSFIAAIPDERRRALGHSKSP